MVTVNPQYYNLLHLHLDDGTKNLSDADFEYQETEYEGRVLAWGAIERSIATPPGGLFQVGSVSVGFADTDDAVRNWFDTRTPFRRIGDIAIGELTSETAPAPVYVGEIGDPSFGRYGGQLELRDNAQAWMDRKIPSLVNRKTFPNLPDGVDEVFARYIFGLVESPTITNVTKQGRIECPLVDTENQRFLVARHICHEIITVYIKKPIDDYFHPLAPEDWSTITANDSVDGVHYTFTLIETVLHYPDGTRIRVDVNGLNYRQEFGSMSEHIGAMLNPVDAIIALSLDAESRTSKYDTDKFSVAHAAAASRISDTGLKIGGCIDAETTYGDAIGAICSDFGIDYYSTSAGKIAAHLDDPDTDDAPVEIDDTLTLRESVRPSLPNFAADVKLRFRYRYCRQYGLSVPSGELAMDGRAKFLYGQWGFEQTLVNAADLLELQVGMMSVFTVNAGSDVCTLVTGNLEDGTPVRLRNLSGALPGGLDADTVYFVINSDALEFQLSLSAGGSAVDISSAGTGTHYVGNPDNSIQEDLAELNFVSNDDVALDLMKERAGWHSIRSYRTRLDLYGPANTPSVMNSIDLTRGVQLTHPQGIQDGGWTDMVFKTVQIRLDLLSLKMEVSVVRHIPQAELFFEASWGGTHPAHAAQTRKPDILVSVNDGATTVKRVNLNSTTPAAPEGFVNLIVQAEEVGDVRNVSFYSLEGASGGFWQPIGVDPADGIVNNNGGPVAVEGNFDVYTSDSGGTFARIINLDFGQSYLQLLSENYASVVSSYVWDGISDFDLAWAIDGIDDTTPFQLRVGPSATQAMLAGSGGGVAFPAYGGDPDGRMLYADDDGILSYLSNISADGLADHFDGFDILTPQLFTDFIGSLDAFGSADVGSGINLGNGTGIGLVDVNGDTMGGFDDPQNLTAASIDPDYFPTNLFLSWHSPSGPITLWSRQVYLEPGDDRLYLYIPGEIIP